MSIDRDTAARVAHLARIRVEEDALPALAQSDGTPNASRTPKA